jgi:2-dehydro-3-deoxyphosphooctonate aldolase (KDO 8-P synthase)
MNEGLNLLGKVKDTLGVPVTTDVHEPDQAADAATIVDILQVPAFLCRQTDLLVACAKTGRAVNVKKGQFVSPDEMSSVVDKLLQAKRQAELHTAACIMLTERGTFFGYNRLVNDFLGLGDLMDLGWPVCFDVTHSTQLPGASRAGDAKITGGRPDRAPMLARCAVAAGVQALFIETHPDPAKGKSDSATMLPLDVTVKLLGDLAILRRTMEQIGAGTPG